MTDKIKDLVMESLDQQGSLAAIKAQIRATVFSAIDSSETRTNESAFYWENKKIQKLSAQTEGQLALELVKDFLESFSLDYSCSVFSSEANISQTVSRPTIAEKCGILYSGSKPVLLQMVEAFLHQDFSGLGTPKGKKTENSSYYGNKNNDKENQKSNKYSAKYEPKNTQNKPVNPLKDNQSTTSNFSKPSAMASTAYSNNFGNSNKYSSYDNNKNLKDKSMTESENYGDEGFEEIAEDEKLGFEEIELDEDDDSGRKNQKKNASKLSDTKSYGLYTSQEDAGLQSQGFDKSVNSLELEDYDYYENATDRKKGRK